MQEQVRVMLDSNIFDRIIESPSLAERLQSLRTGSLLWNARSRAAGPPTSAHDPVEGLAAVVPQARQDAACPRALAACEAGDDSVFEATDAAEMREVGGITCRRVADLYLSVRRWPTRTAPNTGIRGKDRTLLRFHLRCLSSRPRLGRPRSRPDHRCLRLGRRYPRPGRLQIRSRLGRPRPRLRCP